MRNPDPLHRRIHVREMAHRRRLRRVAALLLRLDSGTLWAATDPELRRLDDLLGEADRLWNRL